MKKILLFLLLFAGMANAQFVTFQDPAFYAKLMDLGVDTNSDGLIQPTEALAVTSLDLRQSNIANLNGIEAFTNLATLDCSFNLLSEIDLTMLPNLVTLNCYNNQIEILNVTGLTNLQNLNCGGNNLASLNVQGLTGLQSLDCSINQLASLDVTGLNLQHLGFGYNLMTSISAVTGITGNLQSLGCNGLELTSLNLSAFPNLKSLQCAQNLFPSLNAITGLTANLEELYCMSNQFGTLDVTAFPNLKKLYCDSNSLTSLNVSALIHLEELRCGINQLTTLNLSGLTALTYVDCNNNQISALDLTGLTNIESLRTHFNPLTLNLTGMNSLSALVCSYNQITGVDFSPFTNLQSIYIYGGAGPAALNLSGLSGITELNCSGLGLTSINLSGMTNLKTLIAAENQLTSVDFSGLTNLESLTLRSNSLTSIDLTGLPNIKMLDCSANLLTSLDVSNMPNLKNLFANGNLLSSIDLSNNPNLETLAVGFNVLTDLNVSNATNLTSLHCEQNQLTTLNTFSNPKLNSMIANTNLLTSMVLSPMAALNLRELDFSNNNLPDFDISNYTELTRLLLTTTGRPSLDVSNLTKLFILHCLDNPIPTIDVSNNYKMAELVCGSPELTTLLMKNGATEMFNIDDSPNLAFVCTDENETENIQAVISAQGITSAVVNTYCSFVPGGDYNTITGSMLFDADANGCDANDIQHPNIKIQINDGTTIGNTFTNQSGNYGFYTLSGNFAITPMVENPSFFTFAPATATVPFTNNDNNIANQNFCITANGVHPDIEIVIAPIGPARPGFDATYQLVYKNIGNQILSGDVSFAYDDSIFDYILATQTPAAAVTGNLTWNYTNLLPFESRNITITLNLNSPVETPDVQVNDLLDFVANATPVTGDENAANNQYQLTQVVTGSFDPNAKTCLDGDVVSIDNIGGYLHYNIEFENLGNAEAVNVVVKDVIDTTMFDIHSLQVLHSSHEMRATIQGNVVEFIFENINLEAAEGNPPVGGHGNVLFKIRTLPTLVAGVEVENTANIYFDYNAPIATNTARTAFEVLSNPDTPTDANIVVYPNPAKNNVNINCTGEINTVALFDVQGRLLRTEIVNAASVSFDISKEADGVYFLRITSTKGQKVIKLIKE